MSATARGWAASSVPIVLWIAHLTAVAALAETTCTDRGWLWVPHALTAGLALACVPFLVQAAWLVRHADALDAPDGTGASAGPESAEGATDLRFLGWLGLGMGAASVVLIVAEGLMAVGIDPCY